MYDFSHVKETKVEVMWRNDLQMIIQYRLIDIKSELCVPNPVIWVPKYIYPDRITYKNYERFLCTRLPDKTRDDIDDILKNYGLREFQPVKMCRLSHGRNMTDFLWLRFDDEHVTFDDIKLRD